MNFTPRLIAFVFAALVALRAGALTDCPHSDPTPPDFHIGGQHLDALGLAGRYTETDWKPSRQALATMVEAVKQSLSRHGITKCGEPRELRPKVGGTWLLTLNGRSPGEGEWSAEFECRGLGGVEVRLNAMPYEYTGSEKEEWKLIASGKRFLHEQRPRELVPNESGNSTQQVVIGEVTRAPEEPHHRIPLWARPYSVTVRTSVATRNLLELLDVDQIAETMEHLPEGPLLPAPGASAPTQLSVTDRQRLEQAVYAAILPSHPARPTYVAKQLLPLERHDELRVFLDADLGLPPSLIADFLDHTRAPAAFPSHVALGGRQLIDEHQRMDGSWLLLQFSGIGFSADRQHALITVHAQYAYGRRSWSVIVLKQSGAQWVVEYSTTFSIC